MAMRSRVMLGRHELLLERGQLAAVLLPELLVALPVRVADATRAHVGRLLVAGNIRIRSPCTLRATVVWIGVPKHEGVGPPRDHLLREASALSRGPPSVLESMASACRFVNRALGVAHSASRWAVLPRRHR